ncbi:MAG TPA: hypothetical protein VFS67_30720 [Polyangiaceae bacterium]|nr:hypothetical protein [Polyangiaceae bacterium]
MKTRGVERTVRTVQGQAETRQAVTALRQSAVIASRAARSMELAFGRTNPDRALRHWTTPLQVRRLMSESISYVRSGK